MADEDWLAHCDVFVEKKSILPKLMKFWNCPKSLKFSHFTKLGKVIDCFDEKKNNKIILFSNFSSG